MKKVFKLIAANHLVIIFLLSGASVFGSLYFSEVQGLIPCLLCWYQRIFMYPLFLLSTVSLAFKQPIANKFLLVLSFPGLIIGIYHYIIQNFPAPNQFVPCTGGVDCSAVDWTLANIIPGSIFEYVTIPFLSLVAFLIIVAVVLLNWRVQSRRMAK